MEWPPLASFSPSWHPPHPEGHTESKTLQPPRPEAQPRTTSSHSFNPHQSPCRNKSNLVGEGPVVWLDRSRGCPRGSQTQAGRMRLEECSFRDSLSKRLSDWLLLPFLPSWWALNQHKVAGALLSVARKPKEAYSTMKCVKQNGPREWQISADLTANKPISEIFHAFCSVGRGWGVRRGGGTGGKRRGSEEGCRKLRVDWRWVMIFSFSPYSLLAFFFDFPSHWASDPSSSTMVWWLEKLQVPQKLVFHQTMQVTIQANVSESTKM